MSRYCLELGLAAPLNEIFARVLEREESDPQSSASVRERLLAVTGGVAGDALAARPAAHKGWRRVLSAEREDDCLQTPRRLALAAEDRLGGHDQRELDRHLETCLGCQAVELRVARAERAFDATFLLGTDLKAPPPAAAAPTPRPAAAPTPAAEPIPPSAPAAPVTTPGPHRRRGPAWLFAGAVAVLGSGALALALSGGPSHRAPTPSLPISAPAAVVSKSAKPVTPVHAAPKRVKKRHPARRHRAGVHRKAASVSSTTSPVTAAPTAGTPASAQATPAPASAVTPTPVTPSAPAQPTTSGSVSASQQGAGLPAQNAPTQAIGSLGSNPPGH